MAEGIMNAGWNICTFQKVNELGMQPHLLTREQYQQPYIYLRVHYIILYSRRFSTSFKLVVGQKCERNGNSLSHEMMKRTHKLMGPAKKCAIRILFGNFLGFFASSHARQCFFFTFEKLAIKWKFISSISMIYDLLTMVHL